MPHESTVEHEGTRTVAEDKHHTMMRSRSIDTDRPTLTSNITTDSRRRRTSILPVVPKTITHYHDVDDDSDVNVSSNVLKKIDSEEHITAL